MKSRLGSMRELLRVQLADSLGQCRPAIVNLGGGETGLLAAHSKNPNLDPWNEAYTFPVDTIKLTMVDLQGKVRWTRNLGKGTSPGIWFCMTHK